MSAGQTTLVTAGAGATIAVAVAALSAVGGASEVGVLEQVTDIINTHRPELTDQEVEQFAAFILSEADAGDWQRFLHVDASIHESLDPETVAYTADWYLDSGSTADIPAPVERDMLSDLRARKLVGVTYLGLSLNDLQTDPLQEGETLADREAKIDDKVRRIERLNEEMAALDEAIFRLDQEIDYNHVH